MRSVTLSVADAPGFGLLGSVSPVPLAEGKSGGDGGLPPPPFLPPGGAAGDV